MNLKQCKICNKSILRKQKVCSRNCYKLLRHRFYKGNAIYNWKPPKIKKCKWCKKMFSTKKKFVFCSQQCGMKYNGHIRHKNTKFIKYFCRICGKQGITHPCLKNRKFCSNNCRLKWFNRQFIGDKSPHWRGGGIIYDKHWKHIAENIKKRDGFKCKICSIQKDLVVHHREPYRISKNHSSENLITLCRSCHRKFHIKFDSIMSGKEQRVSDLIKFICENYPNEVKSFFFHHESKMGSPTI